MIEDQKKSRTGICVSSTRNQLTIGVVLQERFYFFYQSFLKLHRYHLTLASLSGDLSFNEPIGRARSWEQVAESLSDCSHTLHQFLLGPSSRGQTLLAGACSQVREIANPCLSVFVIDQIKSSEF